MKIATCSGKSILMDGHDFVLDGIRASEDFAKFCARLLEQCSGLQTRPVLWLTIWVKCKDLPIADDIAVSGYEPVDPWDCMLDVIIDTMASQGH